MPTDRAVSRRATLRAAALLAGGGCLCQAGQNTCCSTPLLPPDCLSFSADSVTIDLARAPQLAGAGSAANVIDKARSLDLILVHAPGGKFHAVSGLCTHYPRPLSYNASRGVLQCNNFNHSTFDLTGAVVKGPAPRPLARYAVRRGAGKLTIQLKGADES